MGGARSASTAGSRLRGLGRWLGGRTGWPALGEPSEVVVGGRRRRPVGRGGPTAARSGRGCRRGCGPADDRSAGATRRSNCPTSTRRPMPAADLRPAGRPGSRRDPGPRSALAARNSLATSGGAPAVPGLRPGARAARPGRRRGPVARRVPAHGWLVAVGRPGSARPGGVTGVDAEDRDGSSSTSASCVPDAAPAAAAAPPTPAGPAADGTAVGAVSARSPPPRAWAASRRAQSWNVGQTGNALDRQ